MDGVGAAFWVMTCMSWPSKRIRPVARPPGSPAWMTWSLAAWHQAHHACIIACMVALQIRDVPEELRDRLSELASQRGQSLQAYLFDVVSNEARRQDNLAVLDRFGQGTYGTRLSSADIAGALRTARAERDAELGVREGER
jgi:hypothetical protein